MSRETSTSDAHTQMKPIQRSSGMGSSMTKAPNRNVMIGVRYCMNPIQESGMRRVAEAKASSGMATIREGQKLNSELETGRDGKMSAVNLAAAE